MGVFNFKEIHNRDTTTKIAVRRNGVVVEIPLADYHHPVLNPDAPLTDHDGKIVPNTTFYIHIRADGTKVKVPYAEHEQFLVDERKRTKTAALRQIQRDLAALDTEP
jgi:hypothetical protein